MNNKPNCTRYDGRSPSYKLVQLGFSFIPQRNEKQSNNQFLIKSALSVWVRVVIVFFLTTILEYMKYLNLDQGYFYDCTSENNNHENITDTTCNNLPF